MTAPTATAVGPIADPGPLPVVALRAMALVLGKKPSPGLDGVLVRTEICDATGRANGLPSYADPLAVGVPTPLRGSPTGVLYASDGHMALRVALYGPPPTEGWATAEALGEALALAKARKVVKVDVLRRDATEADLPVRGLCEMLTTARVPDAAEESDAAYRKRDGSSIAHQGYGIGPLAKCLDIAALLAAGGPTSVRPIALTPHPDLRPCHIRLESVDAHGVRCVEMLLMPCCLDVP